MTPRFALDVSNVNPADTATVKASGCSLLICKAAEGSSYDDKTLAAHRQIARELGIAFGSYLFLHAGSPGNEAGHYLAYANPGPGEIVIIDAEGGGQDGETIAQMARRANACACEIERHGRHPLLYASSSYWLQLVAAVPALKRLRVWEAQYPGAFTRWQPQLARLRVRLRHGVHVSMWQWTDRAQVNGRGYDLSLMFDAPAEMLTPWRKP